MYRMSECHPLQFDHRMVESVLSLASNYIIEKYNIMRETNISKFPFLLEEWA